MSLDDCGIVAGRQPPYDNNEKFNSKLGEQALLEKLDEESKKYMLELEKNIINL